jgi:hypothetical protein
MGWSSQSWRLEGNGVDRLLFSVFDCIFDGRMSNQIGERLAILDEWEM